MVFDNQPALRTIESDRANLTSLSITKKVSCEMSLYLRCVEQFTSSALTASIGLRYLNDSDLDGSLPLIVILLVSLRR